ncbi:MAG: hypothetical protein NC410_09030 [Oscillibacter sp.]|nr:hypothetical protein [Oscillibacter sp.]
MKRLPLDIYDDRPREMRVYLRNNGWHFSKKACEFAVSLMKKKNPATGKLEKITPYTKDEVDELLKKYGIKLENAVDFDYVYVANLGKADFLKSSIPDEEHLAMYIQDVIDDPDAAEGNIMRKWCASMDGAGIPIDWEEIQ